MIKDMFYKYDDNFKEPCPPCECFIRPHAKPIMKLDGTPIGVKADQNSIFDIFFKADYRRYGQNTFILNIYDYTYHFVESFPAFWVNSEMVGATIVADDKKLPYGIYRIELITNEEDPKTIFAANEGVLSIG